MKINNFRGDLSNISAKTATLAKGGTKLGKKSIQLGDIEDCIPYNL